MTALLQVDDVSKRFGALRVVDKFTFDVAEGEALGIVGPNGAGKTTLLNLIAGDLRSDSGSIVFVRSGHHQSLGSRPVSSRDRSHRADPSSVRRIDGVRERARRQHVRAEGSVVVVEGRSRGCRPRQAGMLDKANVVAGSLTLLDRKRLELARALATQPTLLLLDEIAGGLTEGEVLELVDTIKQIREGGVSIVWIEHIVHALLRVVDRMVAVDAGRKLIEGDPHEVMASNEVRAVYLGDDLADESAPGSP